MIFQIHFQDKAPIWYQSFAVEIQGNWESLKTSFFTQFVLVLKKKVDQTQFLNLVVNFRQKDCNIVVYTKEREKLNLECPKKFRDVLDHQFLAEFDDKRKIDLVQVYLGANKSTISYVDARQTIEKAYQRFGEPSFFDNLCNQPSSSFSSLVELELVTLLQSFRIPPPISLQDNPLQQSNFDNASRQDQNGCLSFYCRIYCHNCCKEDHYSTSCSRPVVNRA